MLSSRLKKEILLRKSSAANRYIVQERYAHWGGREGQNRLTASTAVIIGVGALGGTAATLLARAGVGNLRLIDPDSPSMENLHRQILYTEADIKPGVTKAKAAADFLKTANSEVLIEPLVARLDVKNAESLLLGADVVLDGLDNMESRYVLNEACHRLRIPWVHAGVVGSRGQLMVIRAGKKPCLRCWSSPESAAKQAAQVSIQGVIGPTPACVASLQVNEALKILLCAENALLDGLLKIEFWPPSFKILQSSRLENPQCPVCNGKYEYI
jgi:molybdopterin-synthase adenylyltransferase